jgi:hypothetical protein
MSKSAKTRAQNGEYSVKKLLFNAAAGIISGTALSLFGGILYQVSDSFNALLRKIAWNLPIPGLALLSVPLIVSFFAVRLRIIAKKPGAKKKTARLITRIAGLLGLAALTAACAAFVVSSNTPFKEIVVTDNDAKNESVVLKWNVSDLWLKIEGGPMDFSIELSRYARNGVDKAPLYLSRLKRDDSIRQSYFYYPQQGFFRVSGVFEAGDTLVLKTGNTSGFEGKVIFEFWAAPKKGANE